MEFRNSSRQMQSLAFERGLAIRLLFALLILVPGHTWAADVPQSFTLDGRLFGNGTGTSPLTDSSVALRIQILDEDKVCILYEESQTISTLASSGYFSIQVGSATGDGKRTALDSALPMTSVFQNMNNVTGKAVSNGAPCILTATAAKRRYVRVFVAPSTMGGAERQLSPDLGVDSVPNAVVAERAESLQGLRAANMLQVNTSASNVLSQTNLENLFSSTTRFNALTALVDGTSVNYMRSNSASGAQLPVLAGAPSSPTQGAVWYDSTDQKVKFQASGGPVTLSTGGGTVSSVGFTAPAELSVSGAPVTTSGTIAVTWSTQTTNKVLAAPDGSTGVPSFRVLVANDIPSLPWSKITGGPAPLTQGGTGLSAGGSANQILGMDAAGTAAEYKTVTAGSGVSVTHGAGTVTIATTGAAPTGAAGGDLSGTYPNPTVSKLQGVGVSATAPSNGQVLSYDNSVPEWKPVNFSIGSLKTAAGAQQFAGSGTCASNQTLTWSSLTDTFTCTTIASLDAASITTGTLADARLPASATAWTISGSDIYRASGNVGIGTTTPAVALDLGSTTNSLRLPSGTTAQRTASPVNGDFRYNSTTNNVESYVNGSWSALNTAGTAGNDSFSHRQVGLNSDIVAGPEQESYYAFGQAATHASSQTATSMLSLLRAMPFIVTGSTSVDRLAFNIVTAGSPGAKIRVAIYTNAGPRTFYPKNLLLDAGEFAADVTGVNTITVSVTLPANSIVWGVLTANTGSGASFPIMRAIRPDAGQVLNILGWDATLTNQATGLFLSPPYVTGTPFPTTFPTGAGRTTGNIPLLGMRFN